MKLSNPERKEFLNPFFLTSDLILSSELTLAVLSTQSTHTHTYLHSWLYSIIVV